MSNSVIFHACLIELAFSLFRFRYFWRELGSQFTCMNYMVKFIAFQLAVDWILINCYSVFVESKVLAEAEALAEVFALPADISIWESIQRKTMPYLLSIRLSNRYATDSKAVGHLNVELWQFTPLFKRINDRKIVTKWKVYDVYYARNFEEKL